MTLRQVHAVVREFLPPSFDRENIACDLWVEAWRRQTLSSVVTPESDPLDPPLSREVIHNRCVDEIRKKKIREKHMPRVAVLPLVKDEIEEEREWDFINQAIQSLDFDQRQAIFEKFYLGSATRKIAQSLGVKPLKVEALLASALEILRAVVREREFES